MPRLGDNVRVFLSIVAVCDQMLVLSSAVSLCDPLTQYDKDGQCCRKCPPGTRMLTHSPCLEPQCEECGSYEYQDQYSRQPLCQRQPYCDQNKNMQVSGLETKTKRSTCVCRPGFHCAGPACIVCVPHTACPPGQRAKSTGNRTQDTACENCPEGSFSNSSSWNSVCTRWTDCARRGHRVAQSGTDISDNVCEESLRQHGALIAVFAVLGGLLIALVGLVCCLSRGDNRQRAKGCLESCYGNNPPTEPRLGVFAPIVETEKDPELQRAQEEEEEEEEMKMPEENLEEQMTVVLSDNGQCVTQERGKDVVQSQQETLVLTQPPDSE